MEVSIPGKRGVPTEVDACESYAPPVETQGTGAPVVPEGFVPNPPNPAEVDSQGNFTNPSPA